jgi:hypothetical protein
MLKEGSVILCLLCSSGTINLFVWELYVQVDKVMGRIWCVKGFVFICKLRNDVCNVFPCFHWHSLLYRSWRIWSTNLTAVYYLKFNTHTGLVNSSSRLVTCICEVPGSNLSQDTSQLLLSQYWTSQHKRYCCIVMTLISLLRVYNYVFTESFLMCSWFKVWLLSFVILWL